MGTSMKTFVVDMDGTICSTTTNQEYHKAIPDQNMINKINKLSKEGHYIKIFTARGMSSGKDFHYITETQLFKWGVSYDELIMGKPSADYYIDDKGLTPEEFKEKDF